MIEKIKVSFIELVVIIIHKKYKARSRSGSKSRLPIGKALRALLSFKKTFTRVLLSCFCFSGIRT